MEGEFDIILPVNKPPGFSTYDVIRRFKKATCYKKKIGHGGVLDPFATGVVLLLLGQATKRFEEIKEWEKVYLAGIRLGLSSNTGDIAGEITNKSSSYKILSKEEMEKLLLEFTGELEQKVPPYSAAKFKGVPMYKLARQGVEIEKIKKVKIYKIELLHFKNPLLTIRITCSGGVYIRQLAQDIVKKAGCKESLLYFLERERIGNFSLKDCWQIDDFNQENFYSQFMSKSSSG